MIKIKAFKLSGFMLVFAMVLFLLSAIVMPAGAVTTVTQSPSDSDENSNPHNYASTSGNASDGADSPEYAYDTEGISDDETYAVYQNDDDTCDFTGFGTFNIPTTATVDSITVSFRGYNEVRDPSKWSCGYCRDLYVSIAPDGINYSTPVKLADLSTLTNPDDLAPEISLTWDSTDGVPNWSAECFNGDMTHSNLQVRIASASAPHTTAYVSDLQVTISYSTSARINTSGSPKDNDDNNNPYNYQSTDGDASDGADYPTYAYDADTNTYAVYQNNGDTCDFTDFDTFNIPDNATFGSVTVSFTGYNATRSGYTSGNPLRDLTVSIAPDGENFGTVLSADLMETPAGISLTWNWNSSYTDWTPVNFNDKLQVRIASTDAAYTNAYITDLKVTVSYLDPDHVNVTFNSQGGSEFTTKDELFEIGSQYGTLPTVTRDGFTFDGWYTDPSAGTKIETDTIVTNSDSFILYAHWKVNTTTALTSSSPSNTSTYGDNVTFTATITPAVGGKTVTFMDGAAVLGTALTNSTGIATFDISTLTCVPHSITAVFSGDANFCESTSAVLNQTINKGAAAVTLSDLTPVYDGSPKSATVTTSPAGLACDVTYNGSAAAPADSGTYTVVATVNDTNYEGTSADVLVIGKAPSTTTVTATDATYDGNPHGATASATGTGSLDQILTVTYTGTTNAGVTYNDMIAPTEAGSYTASATYAGDTNHTASTGSKAYTINPISISAYTANAIGTQIYNGNPITPTVTIPGLVQGTDYTVSYTNNAAVGIATATATGIGNYTGTTSITFAINYGYVPPSGGNTDDQASTAGSIELNVTTAGHTANITVILPDGSTLDNDTLQSAIETVQDFEASGYNVIVDLSFPDSQDNPFSYTMNAEQLADLAGSTEALLQLRTPLGSIRFDADAVVSLAGQAGTDDVTFTIYQLPASVIAASYPDYAGYPVYDITVSAGGTNITTFGGGEVTVTLPYAPTQAELDSGIVIYYMSVHGPVMVTNCMYDAETGTLSFVTDHLSVYAAGYVPPSLTNDIWYADYFNYLEARGIMDAADFSPNTNITRAEFVTILAAIDGADLNRYTSASFKDVSPSDAYFGAVEWAADNGIVLGYNGYFSPSDSITRQDICTILMRYADLVGFILPQQVDAVIFTDDANIASYAAEAVSGMQQADILNGFPDKSFSPRSNTTQAQAAKIFTVFMQLMIEY